MTVKAYGSQSEKSELKLLEIERREVKQDDIEIEIKYCGVCHSDIHHVQGDWGEVSRPAVPGHEIVGIVTKVGSNVKNFKPNDKVGVGCMVDSCQVCNSCEKDLEQFCLEGATLTYGSEDKKIGGHTFGGYSEKIIVDKNFVLKISDKLEFNKVAPLLCAGITTYSPLKHWKIKKGDKVGIVGLGGLGHMGVKIAAAMGAKVVMITTSKSKVEDAKMLGAQEVIISTESEQMEKNYNTFDFILNTIPVGHDINPYLKLLKADTTMVLVGALEPLEAINGANLIIQRKSVSGSLIGGIKETQEMLDFCAQNSIHPEVEMINMKDINSAFERVKKSDVKYRFVIDMETLK
jgi:uncharacterized zinc-type alcohol dehydrogenase-like protein